MERAGRGGLEGAAAEAATAATAAEVAPAKAASTEAAASETTAEAAAAAEHLADDHAGNDVIGGIAHLLALLPAAVLVHVILGALQRRLGRGHCVAGGLQSGADIAALGVKGLGVEAFGVGKRSARARADDAAAGGNEVFCGLDIGFRYGNLLAEEIQLARVRGGLFAHAVERFI